MKIHDVTVPLANGGPGYPGDPAVEVVPVARLSEGAPYNLMRLSFGTHAGTHVDAPSHLIPGGATVDQLALSILVGKARVVDLSGSERVEREQLEALDLHDDLRLLLRTRRARGADDAGAHLSADAAAYLAQAGLKLVGIDSLSVDRPGAREFPAHLALLSAGVIVVEDLDLSQVEAGEYDMTCLPLRIEGADGAPARVVLRERQRGRS
jgi:arylformamidase